MDIKRTFDDSNTGTSPVCPGHAELQRHWVNAQRLRAEVTAQMLSQAGRRVARLARPALAGLARWWAAARTRLAARRQARRERHRLYRELDAYTDRELEEIGLRRADIPAIARGEPVLRRAA